MHLDRLILSPGKIQNRVDALGKAISKSYTGRRITLCIVLKGAFVFASDLLRHLQDTEVIFISARSYKAMERKKVVVDLSTCYNRILGKDILIIEDIVDTGHTQRAIKHEIAQYEPESLRLCTLLHKPAKTERPAKIDYLGFKIPDKWVVGYGLDYNEKYRNLRGIHTLTEESTSVRVPGF